MNKLNKRVFLIVLDSFGIGGARDAQAFGDLGANTLGTVSKSAHFSMENLAKYGLFNITGISAGAKVEAPKGAYARLNEKALAKHTTVGHWEISGVVSEKALPTYPNGFPKELLDEFSKRVGREVLCNLPYSGTDVIRDFGDEHVKTGALIVYTSADSVFQIAAHEEIVPLEELYNICKIAREMLVGEHALSRVIARPFVGESGDFKRTSNRHDYSLLPPKPTMLDALVEAGIETYGIGKIYDIFAGKGIMHTQSIKNNDDGMAKTMDMLDKDFNGLCFVNLVDFDMLYGHRNDVEGYAKALTKVDAQLGKFIEKMRVGDILMVTADHGCDPGFAGTDHTRECVPLVITGSEILPVDLNERESFADIAATILEFFGIANNGDGDSFLSLILR